MKITNPSVTLKDGLWYGYTANSEGALVKISNQEEVEKYVRIVNAWEAYKTTDKWNPKPGAIYNLDGYVMEVKGDCLTDCMGLCEECDAQQVATISPIQKQEPQAASFPDFEKYSAYKESKTVATSGTNYIAPDNQEELWNDVISLLDIATFQNWAVEMLKDKFTITRKP